MRFIYGTDIENFEGKKVAELEHVVIDPGTNQVTHLVAKKGFLLPEDKVIPISLVMESNKEHIRLYDFEGNFEDLDDFTEYEFVRTNQPEDSSSDEYDENMTPLLAYPPIGVLGMGYIPVVTNPEGVQKKTVQNVPSGSVEISKGDEILDLNGKHVGDVKEVIIAPQSDQITHFIITKGLMFSEEKLIPANWVQGYDDGHLKLVVDSTIVKGLPELER